MISSNPISAVSIGAGAPATEGAPANIVAVLDCPRPTLDFSASPVIIQGTAAIAAPSPHLIAGDIAVMSANLTAPKATLSAYGGGIAHISAPIPAIFASGGSFAALTAPSPQLTSIGHNSYGEQAAFLTAPSPTLIITAGANSKLTAPKATFSAAGTVTIWGAADLTTPNPTLASTGTVSGMASASLTPSRPNLVGYGGAVCSVTLTGKATVQSTGTTGSIGVAQITAPLFELTSTATAQNHGSANLLCPSPALGGQAQAWLAPPTATLTSIGTAVVTASYEAYAINLLRSVDRNPNNNYVAPLDEVTRYTNYPFTHVVRYQGSYYGANSTGLYLLEGTTDDGTAIPFAVKTAVTDFKTPNKKTLASAYFSGRFGPASTISLHEGEKTPNTYSFTTPRGTLAQNHRQKFGKGTKGRYFALSVSGTGTCELDGIEPEVHQLTRRI